MSMNAPVPPESAKTVDRIARGKRLPGRRSKDELAAYDVGAEMLADAHAIMDAVASGRLTKQGPVDIRGKGRVKADEEARLIVQAKAGSIDARNRLITANMGLVHLIARPFLPLGENYHDLVSEGALGIARAIETFEPSRGYKFSTYAVHWIRARVRRAFDKMQHEDEPRVTITSRGEDGDHFITAEDGRKIRRRCFVQSTNEVLFDETGGSTTFGDGLASENESPEDAVIRAELEAEVRRHVDEVAVEQYDPYRKGGELSSEHARLIGDRGRKIVAERLLVRDGSTPRTLQALGDDLGLSREAMRIAEEKMTRALRRRLAAYRPAAATK